MAFDIDAKIKELVNKEGRLIAEIDSFQSNKEWKEANRKSKELLKLQQELLKYRNLKAMMNKDTAEILKLSGFTVDADISPKFKKVMEEYGKGELESSSGEKVTDPKQAKAIAYSEAEEAKDGDTEEEEKVYTKGTEDACTKDAKFEVIYSTGKWPYEVEDRKEIINANDAGEVKRIINGRKKGDYLRIVQITQVHDSDPKVAEAEAIINLCGGVK